ncbi:CBS domain-containing protein [Ferrimonas lipolytica]|uniref:CBS domain-containing protein n=1 Tax=Ferrimonas lipolytica TaxID=2724191 RepID=A0A6H1UBR7_9GAMM|nr:CBS domain-containing protein [Ferrimonas lipolytica]QIZ76089.1 CBS domain-containing protein [Ferrimonas lipolytica]
MESVKVRDYMTKHPVALSKTMSIDSAVETLLQAAQSGAPVVDAEQNLLGFVSEQELLSVMLKSTYHCDLHATVADVMRTDVVTANVDDSVLTLAEQMLDAKPKIYPVVEGTRLIGMINRSRVLLALNTHMQQCYRNSA